MAASKRAKELGARNLRSVALFYGKHETTLNNWFKHNRALFEAAVTYYVDKSKWQAGYEEY